MRTLLTALALFVASSAFAIENTPENRRKQAMRYLEATPPKELLADMTEQMAKNIPEAQQQMFRDAMTKYIDVDALSAAITEAMIKNFTADELGALADFYGSPLGKSAMKKFGGYMADVMPAMQMQVMQAVAKASRPPEDAEKK
jgi:hypothetical protein